MPEKCRKNCLILFLWEPAARRPTVPQLDEKKRRGQRSISLNVRRPRHHTPTCWSVLCGAGPWPLDPLPLEASLPPVRRCLLRARNCCRFLILLLIVLLITEIISQHRISFFEGSTVVQRLRLENQDTHLTMGVASSSGNVMRSLQIWKWFLSQRVLCCWRGKRKREVKKSFRNDQVDK